jgi:O-antigen/teichoic acid export membrane protein
MTPEPSRLGRLTDTRTVAMGAAWNIFGRLGPLLVAVIATPFLVHGLGVARWGIFTLALSLIGMFGVFDFGFGRALTRLIADRVATGAEAASPVVTGIAVLMGLGVAGGLVMAWLARFYTETALHLPPALAHEVLLSLYVLCASAPLVILNGALWGVLSAFQRFAPANLLNVPILAMYYLGPLLMLHFIDSLVAVMAVLVACRLVMTIGYAAICLDAMPSLRQGRLSWRAVLPVIRFGGWMTISNLIWPILLYMDRFAIAAMLSAAMTAYYATPFDLIIRFSVIPIAIMQTAFPAMTTSYRSDVAAARRLFRRASIAIVTLVFPAALLVVGCAVPLLRLWLGEGFATHSSDVLRLLGIGVMFMCADTVPVGLIDGIGRPDVNAKLAVLSLAIYAPAVLVLIRLFGIEGAALGWTLRETSTYLARLFLCSRLYPPIRADLMMLLPSLGAGLAMLVAIACLPSGPLLALSLPLAIVVFAATTWLASLHGDERHAVANLLRRRAA